MGHRNRDRDCEPTQLTVVTRMGAFLSLAYRAQKPRPGRPEAGFCRWIIRTQLPPPAFVIYPIDGKYAVASRADEYRRRAQQCLEMAGTFKEREARATLSHMAEVWLRLAERQPTQPVFQQQQQIQPKNDKA